jgi:hypothetical protein
MTAQVEVATLAPPYNTIPVRDDLIHFNTQSVRISLSLTVIPNVNHTQTRPYYDRELNSMDFVISDASLETYFTTTFPMKISRLEN